MYIFVVIDILQTAVNAKVYRLKLKDESIEFSYLPGQFIRINFDKDEIIRYAEERYKRGEITEEIFNRIKERARKTFREFSITSPPTRKGYIEILVQRENEGGFSPWFFDNIKIGDEIKVDGPYGRFILDENDKNICFIAAGSGIAPLMCHIRYILDKKLDGKFVLIYSNRNLQFASYRFELEEIERALPNFKVFHTLTRLTDEEKKFWNGYTGRINENMIKEILNKVGIDLNECTFYICGGPEFLKTLTNPKAKIDPNEKPGILDVLGVEKEKIKMEIY